MMPIKVASAKTVLRTWRVRGADGSEQAEFAAALQDRNQQRGHHSERGHGAHRDLLHIRQGVKPADESRHHLVEVVFRHDD